MGLESLAWGGSLGSTLLGACTKTQHTHACTHTHNTDTHSLSNPHPYQPMNQRNARKHSAANTHMDAHAHSRTILPVQAQCNSRCRTAWRGQRQDVCTGPIPWSTQKLRDGDPRELKGYTKTYRCLFPVSVFWLHVPFYFHTSIWFWVSMYGCVLCYVVWCCVAFWCVDVCGVPCVLCAGVGGCTRWLRVEEGEYHERRLLGESILGVKQVVPERFGIRRVHLVDDTAGLNCRPSTVRRVCTHTLSHSLTDPPTHHTHNTQNMHTRTWMCV